MAHGFLIGSNHTAAVTAPAKEKDRPLRGPLSLLFRERITYRILIYLQ
jgi:hypothetical protein